MNRIRLALAVAAAGLILAACGVTTPPVVQHTLTVSISGSGSVQVKIGSNAAKAYTAPLKIDEGTKVTLTAVPGSGFDFSSWGGACASASGTTCTVTMDANKTVSAAFTATPPGSFTLDVAFGTGMGSGTVTSDEGVPNISCAYDGTTSSTTGTCTFDYTSGASVTLTAATSDVDSVFAGWGGDCSGTSTTCTLTMDAARSVTATFLRNTTVSKTITLDANNAEEFIDGAGVNCTPVKNGSPYDVAGSIDTTGTPYMELTYSGNWCTQQLDALRFVNVAIPAGATVVDAHIEFVAYNKSGFGTGAGALSLQIYGGLSGLPGSGFVDASAAGSTGQISGIGLTTDVATWDIPDTGSGGDWVADQTYTTDDYSATVSGELATVINDVIANAGGSWSASSNAIVLVIQSSSTTAYRNAYKVVGNATLAPTLVVTYQN